MYYKVEDQEKHPEKYVLADVDTSLIEDECYNLMTKPRQTQRTIGLYLKKLKEPKKKNETPEEEEEKPVEKKEVEKKVFSLQAGKKCVEKEVAFNKGLWVDKPQYYAPLVWKLKEKYSVDIPQKSKKGQGIFFKPDYLGLDYIIKLANAGLLYSDEEISDSEEEIEPDNTTCIPLRKVKYKTCDPCKEKKEKKEPPKGGPPKDIIEELRREGRKPTFQKIPSGCQCDYFGEHNVKPTTWDNPFKDRVDMLRHHEMSKFAKPYKNELLNKNYEKHPPVKFMPYEFGMKRTFPAFQMSNL